MNPPPPPLEGRCYKKFIQKDVFGTYELICFVEKIEAKRYVARKPEYFIKWENYSTIYNTWEKPNELLGAGKAELLKEFRAKRQGTVEVEDQSTCTPDSRNLYLNPNSKPRPRYGAVDFDDGTREMEILIYDQIQIPADKVPMKVIQIVQVPRLGLCYVVQWGNKNTRALAAKRSRPSTSNSEELGNAEDYGIVKAADMKAKYLKLLLEFYEGGVMEWTGST